MSLSLGDATRSDVEQTFSAAATVAVVAGLLDRSGELVVSLLLILLLRGWGLRRPAKSPLVLRWGFSRCSFCCCCPAAALRRTLARIASMTSSWLIDFRFKPEPEGVAEVGEAYSSGLRGCGI